MRLAPRRSATAVGEESLGTVCATRRRHPPRPHCLVDEAVTFLAFSFADSGYLINGVMDTDGDRAHASSKTSFCVTERYNCWGCVATRHGPRSVLGLIPDGAR
jgi:hypothetical protein